MGQTEIGKGVCQIMNKMNYIKYSFLIYSSMSPLPAEESNILGRLLSNLRPSTIFFMILFGVTHPPAGGNPIVVILAASSYEFLINPIIFGTLIIIFYAIILNRFILKKNYPVNWPR